MYVTAHLLCTSSPCSWTVCTTLPCIVGGGVTSAAAVVNVPWHEPKFNGVSSNNIWSQQLVSQAVLLVSWMALWFMVQNVLHTLLWGWLLEACVKPYLRVTFRTHNVCGAAVLFGIGELVLSFWPAQGIGFNSHESLMENLQLTGLSRYSLPGLGLPRKQRTGDGSKINVKSSKYCPLSGSAPAPLQSQLPLSQLEFQP